VYYDDPSKLSAVHCANNNLSSSFCSNLLTHTAAGGPTPALGSTAGTSTIVGNDGSGRVTVGSSAIINLPVIFALPWASTPVCFAQDETTPARNPVTVLAISSIAVTFKPTGTTLFNASDNISYQCTGFK
jgi:hypothetical protein